jgi:hypothetical protein
MGVSAATGRPLACRSAAELGAWASAAGAAGGSVGVAAAAGGAPKAFAVMGGMDSNNLADAGWGVVFGRGIDPRIREALAPLLEHRRAQVGEEALFRVFEADTSPGPDDTALAWLSRRKVGFDVVDPWQGVPFYLMLVAPPEEISFEFQYMLDLYWAAGRVWFSDVDAFRRYAESVVAYEKAAAAAVATRREAVLFAPMHDFDAATQLFTQQVAGPLWHSEAPPGALGARRKFRRRAVEGEAATKSGLAGILSGKDVGGTPALLFTGSHGMGFELGDPRQASAQGALVCQDWPGYGAIGEDHWFAGGDLGSDARVHGMIHVLFACYGAGCPALDNFDRMNGAPKRIAPGPLLARLPQALLSHPNGGALAVLGHVERAWSYSFQTGRGRSRVQGFRDVLEQLMMGRRIGAATDQFNVRWAAISTELAERQLDATRGEAVDPGDLGRLWVARDDARNYIIHGDPAVRLRVEDMPELGSAG